MVSLISLLHQSGQLSAFPFFFFLFPFKLCITEDFFYFSSISQKKNKKY